jgi:glycosyltransferase involved in cell wall biosynthesis
MKLLFVLPEYPPCSAGGISTFYKYLLPELSKQGCQVRVIVGSAFTSAQPSYKSNGVSIEFLETKRIYANLAKFNRYSAIPALQHHLAAAWAMWEQAQEGQGYDLVETTDWGLLFAPWIASSDSPPIVVQLHGSIGQIDFHDPQFDSQLYGSFVRLLETNCLFLADELQANSTANAQTWRQLIGREVNCIPPAFQVAFGSHEFVKSTNGIAVGRVQYWKGPTVLCEALQMLGDRTPQVEWIGRDTAYRESGSSMASHLKQAYPDIWGVKVHPRGQLPPDEVHQLQAKAGFIVVPSIWDVFNYTCVEGMAQGKIVLCSQGAGASELINDGINGLTFTAHDSQSLAQCLDTFLSLSYNEREQMGQSAQQTILSCLQPSRIAQCRLEAYEKLLQRGKFATRPNTWLLDAISPGPSIDNPFAFLNQFPLKALSHHVLRRSFKKLMK